MIKSIAAKCDQCSKMSLTWQMSWQTETLKQPTETKSCQRHEYYCDDQRLVHHHMLGDIVCNQLFSIGDKHDILGTYLAGGPK